MNRDALPSPGIVTYRARLAGKRLGATALGLAPAPRFARPPAVTVFVTSTNNRDALELTLRSLVATTRYPNVRLRVADNGSTDGTADFLRAFARTSPIPVDLVLADEPRPQHLWYDEMRDTARTPYWVGMHEDMILLGRDWLADLVAALERDPSCALLGGERFPSNPAFVEPVSHAVIDLRESLSTWLFAVRTEAARRVGASFAFYKTEQPGQKAVCYDQGGRFIEEVRAAGLRFACMPPWYRLKYHHVGSLSYWHRFNPGRGYARLKRYQLEDVRRRAERLRLAQGAPL